MWIRILAKVFIAFVLVKLTLVMFRRGRQIGFKSMLFDGRTGLDLMGEAFPGAKKWFIFIGMIVAVVFLKKWGR
jgi:hypothetical protein